MSARYDQLMNEYNEIIRRLNSRDLTFGVERQNKLIEELEELKERVRGTEISASRQTEVISAIDILLSKTRDLTEKISEISLSMISGISKKIELKEEVSAITTLKIRDIEKIEYKIPIYAKIILLGESSVGKTHLILTMSGLKYQPTQGSTVGVDKYYIAIKTVHENYNTE